MRSYVSRGNISRLSKGNTVDKTGGEIKLQPAATDVTKEKYISRDPVTVIEGEWRQFENKKYDKLHRYVEQIVTGEFQKVQKEVDLNRHTGEEVYDNKTSGQQQE